MKTVPLYGFSPCIKYYLQILLVKANTHMSAVSQNSVSLQLSRSDKQDCNQRFQILGPDRKVFVGEENNQLFSHLQRLPLGLLLERPHDGNGASQEARVKN